MKLFKVLAILAVIFFSFNELEARSDSLKAYKLALDGVEMINQGKYIKAAELLNEAISLDPANIAYPYELALAYYKKEDYEKAVEILDTLKEKPGADEKYYQLLGNSYDFMGKKEKAKEIYVIGLAQFPNSGRLYKEIGIIHYSLKERREARRNWEAGTKVEPSYPTNYYWLSKYFSRTGEKVYSIIYQEIYLNITKSKSRLDEISELLFDTYETGLFGKEDGSDVPGFTQVHAYEYDFERTPFGTAFEITMDSAAKAAGVNERDDLTLNTMHKMRTNFIDLWSERGFDERFPNIIFNFHKQLMISNNFEAYNFWIMQQARPEEYAAWLEKNSQKLGKLGKWLNENHLVIDEDNNFSTIQY